MRIVVFTALFAAITQAAFAADPPVAMTRCTGPNNCITINTGPCGTLMTNDRDGLMPGVRAQINPNFPRIEGVCGFYDPPFYAQDTQLTPLPPSGSSFPPIPTYISPP